MLNWRTHNGWWGFATNHFVCASSKKSNILKKYIIIQNLKRIQNLKKKLELKISTPYIAGCCSDLVSALFGMICCPVSYRRCLKAFRRNWSCGEKINISLDFRVNWTLEHRDKGNINWISLFWTAKVHIFHSADHIFFNHMIANYEDLLFRLLLILRCKTLNCKII